MYVCMYVCMDACMHVCTYVCMHAFMHVCMYACMYASMYVCMYVCMNLHLSLHVTVAILLFDHAYLALNAVVIDLKPKPKHKPKFCEFSIGVSIYNCIRILVPIYSHKTETIFNLIPINKSLNVISKSVPHKHSFCSSTLKNSDVRYIVPPWRVDTVHLQSTPDG